MISAESAIYKAFKRGNNAKIVRVIQGPYGTPVYYWSDGSITSTAPPGSLSPEMQAQADAVARGVREWLPVPASNETLIKLFGGG